VELIDLYRTMSRIRAFEERVAFHFREGAVQGFVHISIGQEAVAAGVCAALEAADYITTTHRGHGHCLAKGADPVAMMAELFGRETGLCGGRGGSMHLADPRLGILGANGIVGAGIPLATGAALSAQLEGEGRLAVAFFGEGAVHTGAFHEALTLAVAWELPVLFVCESNGWVEFTPIDKWRGPTLVSRAENYGLRAESIDGGDAEAVRELVAELASSCRAGGGPAFVEARTVRGSGHYEGDAQHYRDEKEWHELDPIARFRRLELVDLAQTEAVDQAAAAEMDEAVAVALSAPFPDPTTALMNVFS
jgi:TPP-dependent pyruvate/acetoin dehydrogenase alpha subunit